MSMLLRGECGCLACTDHNSWTPGRSPWKLHQKHKVMPSTLMCARSSYLKPQADGCSQRQCTASRMAVQQAPSSLLHLIKVNGLLPVVTRRQGAPGILPDGSHNGSSGHLSLRCEAVEGCDGCGSQLDPRDGVCYLCQLQQAQRDRQRRDGQEWQVMPCASISELPP